MPGLAADAVVVFVGVDVGVDVDVVVVEELIPVIAIAAEDETMTDFFLKIFVQFKWAASVAFREPNNDQEN